MWLIRLSHKENFHTLVLKFLSHSAYLYSTVIVYHILLPWGHTTTLQRLTNQGPAWPHRVLPQIFWGYRRHIPLHLGFFYKSESELFFSPLQTEHRGCVSATTHSFSLSFFPPLSTTVCEHTELSFLLFPITHREFPICGGLCWVVWSCLVCVLNVVHEAQRNPFCHFIRQ